MSVEEQLYLVSDSMRFANKTNSAVLVVEFSRDAMAEWCALFPDSNAVSVLCNASPADSYFVFGAGLSAQEQEAFQADLTALAKAQADAAPPEEALVKLDGVAYLRLLHPLASGSLWTVGYVQMASLQLAGQTLMTWQVIFTLFLVLEILLFLYLIHRMIAKPMARFAREVTQLKEEGVQLSPGERGGDMDFLYRSFVEVSDQLKQSMEQA